MAREKAKEKRTLVKWPVYVSYDERRSFGQVVNPSKRDSAARKVIAVARSIVTYQIGLPPGCLRMQRTLIWLAPHEADLPTVFDEYLNAVRNLPISSERLLWNREVVKQKDVALEETNRRFRDQIFDACWTIIDRFGESSPSGGQ